MLILNSVQPSVKIASPSYTNAIQPSVETASPSHTNAINPTFNMPIASSPHTVIIKPISTEPIPKINVVILPSPDVNVPCISLPSILTSPLNYYMPDQILPPKT